MFQSRVTVCSVDLKPGDCELVVDGGRALQPSRYRLFIRMSLLFSTHTAHIRAVGTPHTTHLLQRTRDTLLTVGIVT